LQKAEIEWNSEYHIPFQNPKSLQKTGAKRAAPMISIRIVIRIINCVLRTMPPTVGAEIASCMVLRCINPILRPDTTAIAIAIVIIPIPPI
jgi:hypothetical protein